MRSKSCVDDSQSACGPRVRWRRSVLTAVLAGVLFSATPGLGAQATPDEPCDDSRVPGIVDFFPDLVRDARGLVVRRNLLPLLIGTGAVVATHPADEPVGRYFGGASRLGFLERVGDHGGDKLPFVAAGLMVVGQLQGNTRFRRFTYDLAEASAVTGLVTSGLKVSVGRRRPSGNSHLSFPSGHTSSAFTVAAVAAEHYGWPAALAGYFGATLVGVSRLDAEQHYLSDVVAGAAIGYIVGLTTVRRGDERYRRLTWTPLVLPEASVVGLHVAWSLGD